MTRARLVPALIAAAALVVFGVWYAFTVPGVLNPDNADDAADFPNYYYGGVRLLDGDPVYDELGAEIEDQFDIPDYDTYPADPPPTVALFAPFSLLPYEAAWLLWSGLSILLLAGSAWVVAREVAVPPGWAGAIAAGSLLTTPARFLLTRNHMESLVLALGVAGWLALRRGRDRSGAAWFGAATGLKFFPGIWLLGVLRRDRRAAVAGFAVAGLILILGVVVLGLDNTTTFVGEVIGRSRRWYGTLGNYSLMSFGSALVAPWMGWLLTAVGAVLLLGRYLHVPRPPDQLWVMGTAAALLLSPLSWLNYLVLAVPGLVIVGRRLDLQESSERLMLVGLTVGLAFWGPQVFASQLLSVLVSFIPTYALAALFLVADHRLEDAWPSDRGSQTSH